MTFLPFLSFNLWLSGLEKNHPDLKYAIKNGEKRIGPRNRKVDGYLAETDTAFEFDGCFFHGCECVRRKKLNSGSETNEFNKLMNKRRGDTIEKHEYLRKHCNLVVMKECEFKVAQHFPVLTSENLLIEICNGNYFGAAVCDVSVPDNLKPFFAEMLPVFKNVSVTVGDVGTT